MGSERRGSVYLVIVVGAVLLIGVVAGLQIQMDQQMARVRRMKAGAEAALIARFGVEEAGRRLSSTGSLPPRFTETMDGGDLVVTVEGPRPAGSRKYIVFGRARFAAAAVTAVADVRYGSPVAPVCNVEMLYQDIDVDSGPERAKLIATRREARRALKALTDSYRGEGPGLSSRLASFLGAASLGTLPRADQARIASALPTPLTTDVP